MTDGQFEIDEQTFKSWDTATQNWTLFLTFNKHRIECDKRFCKSEQAISALEKRKKFDTAIATGSGFFGGFTAIFARWLLTK